MRLRTLLLASGVAAAAFASNAALAGTFLLSNTGVDATGAVKANGAAETNYTVVGTPLRVATSANGFPIPPWLGDNSTSAWIGPVSSDLSAPAGDYVYRTTFTLSSANFAAARISGQWSTDDAGLDVLINGVSTNQTAAGFTSWTNFAINSGFVAGVNTLDFRVNNGGGPTGLRVEMTGEVPEPATWGLMALGFGLVGFAARRRRGVANAFA